MESKVETVTLARFVPKGTNVKVSWDNKIGLDKYVTKGKCVGKVSFPGSSTTYEVKSHISGRIIGYLSEPMVAQEDLQYGTLELLSLVPCRHDLAFEGVCTYCNETGIKSHTRKIFDQISSISASDDLVEDKLNEVLKGGKYILILDLDNTIIHARDAPAEYNLFEHFPNEQTSEYFETCVSKVNRTKYIVRKRPLLNQFLQ